MKAELPKRALQLLEWICPEYLFEGIAGDIEEQYIDDLQNFSSVKAKRRMWWNVIRFVRPEILFRNKFKINNTTMVNNYFKVASRNMARKKLFSFINAFGLSIGLAFCVLIYLFIQDENSFDKFHADMDNIYRIETKEYDFWNPEADSKFKYTAWLQTGLGPTLLSEVPQVKNMTRYNSGGEGIVTNEGKVFNEKITFVDSGFFQMFTFKLLKGDKNKIFSNKNEIVITPEIADKYFNSQDILGKSLRIDYWGEKEFTISGVIEPAPSNSSFTFSILMSQVHRPYYEHNVERWGNRNTPTFVQLHDQASLVDFDNNLDEIEKKYLAESIKERVERYNPEEGLDYHDFQYKNLGAIHLDTDVSWYKASDPQYSYILGGISLLILIIACINYIALSLTASASRKNEVGVRKAVGAQQGQLIGQFVFESILTAFISMVIGLILVMIFLPFFNQFTGKEIVITGLQWFTIVGLATLLSIVIGLIAGSYPAFFIARFKPITALKSGFTSKVKAGFTKPLVVLQFALSTFLIISTIIMYNQMEYVTSKDLGFEDSQTIVLSTQQGWSEKSNQTVAQLRRELGNKPIIEEVAGVSLSFNEGWSRNGYRMGEEHKSAYVYTVDPYYISLLDIEITEGRNFDPQRLSDSSAIIVNEALVKDMGWEDPISEYLNWQEDSTSLGYKVIGVTKNYHFLSLEQEIEPMLLTMRNGYLSKVLIKLKADNVQEGLSQVESTWKELYPDKPFDYSFIDDDIQRQYESYDRWMSIMQFSTVFAILISCLGLFGLSGINAVNRTKEIGIRKVFGASLHSIYILLNKQYLLLVFIAFVLAVPASWYVMDIWISDFQYSITLHWQLFAISLLVGLVVAITTVTYHAINAASQNPSSTLKYE